MIVLLILISLGVVQGRIFYDSPPYNCSYCQPEQIHISFGEKLSDIVVTWTTFNDTEESRVQYGAGVLDKEASGESTVFADGRGQYIHRVTLPDLQYDTKYLYHCGSKYGWSARYEFKTPPGGNNAMIRAVIFGDMGVENAHSLPYLQDECERDRFDFVLHVGDFAYDMYEREGRQGDQFMRQVEPLAAAVPYMTVPGNHEENRNFVQYKSRFSMPGRRRSESMFYSWDIGPVHWVAVNTEAYYFLNYGLRPLVDQFTWLQADLERANQPENRAKHGWLIVYGHRPMYCSNSDDEDCSCEKTRCGFTSGRRFSESDTTAYSSASSVATARKRPWLIVYGHRPMYCSNKYDDCWNNFLPNRVGIPFLGMGMEPLLKQYGVDIVIWAHEHSYERTWPLYDGKVYNGSVQQPYVNPRAPIHVVTGSAGCREKTDPFVSSPAAWSAFRSSDYGYTRFRAHNHSHLYFEQVSVDRGGDVIDSFWVVKDSHQPYRF